MVVKKLDAEKYFLTIYRVFYLAIFQQLLGVDNGW